PSFIGRGVFLFMIIMKKSIIKSLKLTLNKSKDLLIQIDSESYINNTIGPFYSSVGSHIRHTLDFLNCILYSIENNNDIDLTLRNRDETISKNKYKAIEEVNSIKNRLDNIKNIEDIVYVIDDCGTGKIGINYTLESILAQANSHTIHHFASISFILHQLNIDYEIKGFGYNPTTPIPKRKGI
ncbi:hypothetical protein, partial [Croceibacter atlanticus]|uniref:hypothetical protein n=1 Tax=Croceibacter atlanticus TaxID=313588 RepID=UPI0030D8EA7D